MANAAILSLAFSAGLVSFVDPCGFALLPVYVTYYFKNEGLEKSSLFRRIFAALVFGLMVSIGFAAVFLVIGLIVSYIGRGFFKYIGWFDLGIGILLVIIGSVYLFNLYDKFHLNRLTNLGERLKYNKLKNKYMSFFVYGMGFAIVSLGCTLPIFLLVVTSAIQSSGFLNGTLTFLVYAAGMSFFMILFSLAVAISKNFMEKTLSKLIPYIYRIGSIIVIIAGLYLIYNQIAFGRLIT